MKTKQKTTDYNQDKQYTPPIKMVKQNGTNIKAGLQKLNGSSTKENRLHSTWHHVLVLKTLEFSAIVTTLNSFCALEFRLNQTVDVPQCCLHQYSEWRNRHIMVLYWNTVGYFIFNKVPWTWRWQFHKNRIT